MRLPPNDMTGEEWNATHVQTGDYPPQTYLLIDDLFVARQEGTRRVAVKPQKLPEPVLKGDKPWEGNQVWLHNGFFYDQDEKLFKIYYHSHDPSHEERHPQIIWPHQRVYAYSHDCLHWEKPDLGLVEWNGSTKNNIVDCSEPSGGDGPNTNVFKDYNEPDGDRRYKAMGMERHLREPGERAKGWKGGPDPMLTPLHVGWFLYDSPDGFTWKRRPRNLMTNAMAMDGSTMHGYDEDYQAWIFWLRARAGWRGDPASRPATTSKYRTLGVSFTRDLEKIPYPQMILAPDESDPPGMQFNSLGSIKVPGGYVGLLNTSGSYDTSPFSFWTAQLAFSRDARVWGRPAGREAYVRGDEDGWDQTYGAPGNPVQVGADIYIIYSGYAQDESAGIGLVRLKRDRWAAIEPVGPNGALLTKPTYWAQPRLSINAEAPQGSIRAELLDPWGRPVEGYTVEESDRFTGDDLDHLMTWQGKAEIPQEVIGAAYWQGNPGRLMSIRFYLDSARLYSFTC